jgi:hypothetical protein
VNHEIPHHLSLADVRAALERAADHYASKYAKYRPSLQWHGHRDAEVSMTALGITIKAKLHLLAHAIKLSASVPLPLRPFVKKAIAAMDREIHKWLKPAGT